VSRTDRGFVSLPPQIGKRSALSSGALQAGTEARVRAAAKPLHVFKCLKCKEGLASLEYSDQDGLRLAVWSPLRLDGDSRVVRTGRPIAVPVYFVLGPKAHKARDVIEVVCSCGEPRRFPVGDLRKLSRVANMSGTSSR
jgi:RNase P subunit RPR2